MNLSFMLQFFVVSVSNFKRSLGHMVLIKSVCVTARVTFDHLDVTSR